MRKPLCTLLMATALAMVAHAEDWTGNLIDSVCNDQKEHTKTISCDATTATTAFALDVAGTIYKLDAPGNIKAAAAMKYRAVPAPDPSKPPSTEVKAKITGTEAGGMILVDSIGLQ
jgi:hypothetical protein